MTHEIDQDIKRREDGSIDTQYYMTAGRDMRSAQAHKMAAQGVKAPTNLGTKLGRFAAGIFAQRLFKNASSAKY